MSGTSQAPPFFFGTARDETRLSAQILGVLRSRGPLTAVGIYRVLFGASYHQVRSTLRTLKRAGQVEYVDGAWRAVP